MVMLVDGEAVEQAEWLVEEARKLGRHEPVSKKLRGLFDGAMEVLQSAKDVAVVSR